MEVGRGLTEAEPTVARTTVLEAMVVRRVVGARAMCQRQGTA